MEIHIRVEGQPDYHLTNVASGPRPRPGEPMNLAGTRLRALKVWSNSGEEDKVLWVEAEPI